MLDYIIVGSGIAGVSFAELALQNGKSFVVYDNYSTNSSRIAGGLYNPVILKRFSEVWKAKEQLEFALPFYKTISERIATVFDFPIPVYRKFASIEEQNNWFHAADKPNLAPFLATEIIHKEYQSITSTFGFGQVLQTGYVDVAMLLDNYIQYLSQQNAFINETFDYSQLIVNEDAVVYKGTKAKNIIFSEGFGLHANPYFNNLPLDGTKGELLIIKAPDLNLDVVLKSSIFILPIGNDLFKVGATYNWEDKTDTPTEEGKQELIDSLKELIDCDVEIISHFAGVRPTVKDRRPLVGHHTTFKKIHVLNGLGTRGVMLGPWLAKALFENIENSTPLDNQISIRRFDKKIN
ncbi:FAD-binding oxidoreductase [Flavobacterium amnicola]|uniref:FAD-binding oxidoreductase n=1 Tax=Flavobacterium amnicola TaxID=2506422 RepID=A0A4Q1K5S1_9FLAO|nr:FAD-binding oxidoreductase [Flavobacterium amnicola]RXR20514.1 FAD-binding oxidoreductase [Flavobacterium amnicola]